MEIACPYVNLRHLRLGISFCFGHQFKMARLAQLRSVTVKLLKLLLALALDLGLLVGLQLLFRLTLR